MTTSPRSRPSARRLTTALAAAVLLALGACAPGGGGGGGEATEREASDVDQDVAAMGDLTLTVWDQEVRGGQAEQIEQLNEAFQEKYPNVTIKRVSRSFDDLRKTLRLAITNDEAPDVVQANNGRSDMGQFVQANLLRPLDGYADAYGWNDRYPESVRALASYGDGGKNFGEGTLYGLPQAGELVGLWYNKAKLSELGLEVPRTTDDLEAALQAAKGAGEVPIQFGNLEGWPGIHDFGFVQNQFVPRDEIRDLGFGRAGASWETEPNTEAATTFSDWVEQGYFTEDFNGLGYDAAWQDFAKGNGVFLVAGTWLLADLQGPLGDDLGFALPPTNADGEQSVTGGTSLPFAITEASQHADAAAAYIDFITSADAMQTISEAGNLPVVDASTDGLSGAQAEVVEAWLGASERDELVPYLDYATPDMYDLVVEQVQRLSAGSASPDAFTTSLEDEYSSFTQGEDG